MDCRITLDPKDSFLEMLMLCKEENRTAEMLMDINGLERAGGHIQSIEGGEVMLESGQRIVINTIVALNGIFAESYAGC